MKTELFWRSRQTRVDEEDARYPKLEPLRGRRRQVVRLPLKGYGVMAIVGMTGLS